MTGLYNLVARRYLAQFFPPFEYFQLEAEITVGGQLFTAKSRQPIAPGWKRLFDSSAERDEQAGADDGPSSDDDLDLESPLPPLQPGQAIRIAKTRTVAKKTKPPKRFTAAGLVQAMTGIAKYVSNPQIKALLRETDGIETPATQASIIQRLFDRHFIEEQKRHRCCSSGVPAGSPSRFDGSVGLLCRQRGERGQYGGNLNLACQRQGRAEGCFLAQHASLDDREYSHRSHLASGVRRHVN